MALFLLLYVAIPFHTLINSGAALRQFSIRFSPNIFYLFENANWLGSVFCYFICGLWFTKTTHLSGSMVSISPPFYCIVGYVVDSITWVARCPLFLKISQLFRLTTNEWFVFVLNEGHQIRWGFFVLIEDTLHIKSSGKLGSFVIRHMVHSTAQKMINRISKWVPVT